MQTKIFGMNKSDQIAEENKRLQKQIPFLCLLLAAADFAVVFALATERLRVAKCLQAVSYRFVLFHLHGQVEEDFLLASNLMMCRKYQQWSSNATVYFYIMYICVGITPGMELFYNLLYSLNQSIKL